MSGSSLVQDYFGLLSGDRVALQSSVASVIETEIAGIFVGTSDYENVLVLARSPSETAAPPAVSTRAFKAEFNVPVLFSGDTEPTNCAVLTWQPQGEDLREFFLIVCDALFTSSTIGETGSGLRQRVTDLLWIFSMGSSSRSRDLVGLMGELAVIICAVDPVRMLKGWRVSDQSRYDFSFASYRADVKTTLGSRRSHYMSYAQANNGGELPTFLISALLDVVDDGTSGKVILSRLTALCEHDAALSKKLLSTVAETAGSEIASFLSLSIDLDLFRSQIRVFNVMDVPAVRGLLPAGVSEVSFRSDLSVIEGAGLDSLE